MPPPARRSLLSIPSAKPSNYLKRSDVESKETVSSSRWKNDYVLSGVAPRSGPTGFEVRETVGVRVLQISISTIFEPRFGWTNANMGETAAEGLPIDDRARRSVSMVSMTKRWECEVSLFRRVYVRTVPGQATTTCGRSSRPSGRFVGVAILWLLWNGGRRSAGAHQTVDSGRAWLVCPLSTRSSYSSWWVLGWQLISDLCRAARRRSPKLCSFSLRQESTAW